MESMAAGAGAAPPPRPERPHVVLIASPGAGHLIPMAELARRLVTHHALAATLVTFMELSAPSPDTCTQSSVLSSLREANVSTATLPAVPLDDLPADVRIDMVFFELIQRSIPHLGALLRDIGSTTPLAALVPDFFCAVALPLAAELGVPGYLFFPTNLSVLSVMRSTVEINDGVGADGNYRDLPDPLHLPSGVSLHREELPEGFRSSTEPVYALLVDEGRRYRTAAGFLVNDFYEMDPAIVEEFKKAAEHGKFPPVYAVGPFVRSSSGEGGASTCIEWLDCQPTGSVVYVSFGSTGALSVEQTAELAAGLEDSGHRFLWVVRMPSLDGEHADWGLKPRGDKKDPLAWLPEGFLERTRGRGLVVPSWAPQARVLSHPATAAFVSHCGWNSAMESVSSGVPMVAWPLHSEQCINALVLSENAGVALRLRVRAADGLVGREEVAAAVRELMEGENGRAVRRRMGDLQQAAASAWAPEGSSRQALLEVARKWKAAAARNLNR